MNTESSIQNKNVLTNSSLGGGGEIGGNSAIVMDIGGTKIKIGIVQGDKILCTSNIDAESSKGLKDKLPAIENAVNAMLQQNNIQVNEISGVGISMPGIVDSIQKKILSIDNKFNDVIDMNLSEWIYIIRRSLFGF